MRDFQMEELDHLNFWINYFGISYPNSYDEENDVSVSEMMYEIYTDEIGSWWDTFTGYCEEVFDESDGYLDEPATLNISIAPDENLKIEFHPGDTLYFINEEQIGCTGPHWKLQVMPYEKVEQLLSHQNGRQLFLLLLPLALVKAENAVSAQRMIKEQMKYYFSEELSDRVSQCILWGLAEEYEVPEVLLP